MGGINKHLTTYGLLTVCLAALAGCSPQADYAPVSGTVYYKGKPVESGVVMFQPAEGEVARGLIQSDGTYTLETLGEATGVRPGMAKVRVSVRANTNSNGGEVGLGKLLIPERYTDFDLSGLTFEVTPTRTEPYDIQLTDSP